MTDVNHAAAIEWEDMRIIEQLHGQMEMIRKLTESLNLINVELQVILSEKEGYFGEKEGFLEKNDEI